MAQAPVVVPALRQADNVAVITIRGVIDSTTESSVRRRLYQAERSGADAVVFEIDTPGGEVGAVLEICNLIKSSAIANTVAWINPDAYSGGAIIALACREIVVASPSSIGDALPVIPTLSGLQEATDVMPAAKILPPLLAEVTDSARLRGWDEYLVQAMIAQDIELWLIERKDSDPPERYCIDADEYRSLFGREPQRGLAMLQAQGRPNAGEQTAAPSDTEAQSPSEDPKAFRPASRSLANLLSANDGEVNELDLLERPSSRPVFKDENGDDWTEIGYATDGSSVVVLRASDSEFFGLSSATIQNDAELLAFFGGQNLRRLDANWSEHLVVFLSNPIVRGILIATFLIALFIELTHPGVALPGAIAAVALFLGIAPAMLLGLATWWEVAAIVLGIVLILVELFIIPGFGIFGLSGLGLVFIGLVWTFVGSSSGLFPDSPTDRTNLLYGLTTVTLSIASAGVGIYFLPKKLHNLPMFSKLVLDDRTDDGEPMLAAISTSNDAVLSVGDEGIADTPLVPTGRGRFGSELLDVRSGGGFVEAGTPIRVTDISGMTPEVRATRNQEDA